MSGATAQVAGEGVVWSPTAEQAAASNVGRFMALHGFASYDALHRRSVDDPAWFWDAVVQFLGLPFDRPYTEVFDEGRGPAWCTWFGGGRLNLATICVDRWAETDPDRRAVVWEGEDGSVRRWTFAELRSQADGLAHLLRQRGIGRGDAVAVYLPMVPEAVATVLAVAKLGAVFLPLFSGFAAEAVAVRLVDGAAKALVTADGYHRRGRLIAMKEVADRAVATVPSVATVVVVPRTGTGPAAMPGSDVPGRDVPWPEPTTERFPTESVDAEHPLFIAYTSGTTGRPKGAVQVHGGWTVKVAAEAAFQLDCRAGDTLFWFTDMGWIMGPYQLTGGLANGATIALYEGAPDHPGPDRLWQLVEDHGITILGLSPTLVRALMPHGDGPVARHDLSSLRILASTGEPWNEGPWYWYFDVVGGRRCPVINLSGGTEVGGCFLSPHPVQPLKAMSLGGPALGMAVDVFDDEGRSVRRRVGELVCRRPWPSMTRGLHGDPERYLETYWSRWPDVWVHGDWASVDADGHWYLHGRSDDTVNVAGKRVGPAEVESVLVSHPSVVEAAVVGLPHDVKGEELWCFVVLDHDARPGDELRRELSDLVAARLGSSFRPGGVRFTSALPKTRNAKILRRAIRAAALGTDPGDLSSLDDPAAIDAVRAAV